MAAVMFFSARFNRNVWVTDHAQAAMRKRSISLDEVREITEQGDWRDKDGRHGWLYRHFPNRADNLVCVAVVVDQAVIIKTVLTHWQLAGVPQ